MKGDMAFFYHSNCKVPGIVGTMEIVQEHSVDGEMIFALYLTSLMAELPLRNRLRSRAPLFRREVRP